jgi:HK97 family phage major capsid protein
MSNCFFVSLFTENFQSVGIIGKLSAFHGFTAYRNGAEALIPEEVSKEIINGTRKESVTMKLMKRLPNVSTRVTKIPVLSLLPSADFVDGDAGMKIVTSAEWSKKQLIIGEIAAIIVVPDAVINDAAYNIWGEIQPLLAEQFARVWDRQVLQGGNPKAPVEFPAGIIPQAISAGNVVTLGTGLDVLDDLNEAVGLLEDQEYDVTGIAAQKNFRTKIRGLRDSNNGFLFSEPTSGSDKNPFGIPIEFVGRGTWDRNEAQAVVGDWDKAVYAMRQDIKLNQVPNKPLRQLFLMEIMQELIIIV